MKTAKSLLPIISAVVLLLIIFRIWVPNFLNPENLLDLAQQVSINAILAFGITLVILTGGIDLSIGALVALVGTSTVFLFLVFSLMLIKKSELGVNFVTSLHREHLKN